MLCARQMFGDGKSVRMPCAFKLCIATLQKCDHTATLPGFSNCVQRLLWEGMTPGAAWFLQHVLALFGVLSTAWRS
eukprot:scaffold65060_cov16-Tisochrysis_lutea.AAC.1